MLYRNNILTDINHKHEIQYGHTVPSLSNYKPKYEVANNITLQCQARVNYFITFIWQILTYC